jgi:hypothetical protein
MYWCCAQVEPRRERLASHCLGLAGYEIYQPLLREQRRSRHGSRKIIVTPQPAAVAVGLAKASTPPRPAIPTPRHAPGPHLAVAAGSALRFELRYGTQSCCNLKGARWASRQVSEVSVIRYPIASGRYGYLKANWLRTSR